MTANAFAPVHIVGLGGTLRRKSRSLLALNIALEAAREQGATIELLDVREANLPMFDPEADEGDYPAQVAGFLRGLRRGDGFIFSTGAYHGTLAGVTKNALDYFEYLSDVDYLNNKPVGLIALASGEIADVNSIAAMTHVVHSLRGLVIPLAAPLHGAKHLFDEHGSLTHEKYYKRLAEIGRLVVDVARKVNAPKAARHS